MTREPTEGPEEARTGHRPQFARALGRALVGTYDHLGLLAVATFLWGLAIGLPLAGATALLRGVWVVLAAALVLVPASAAANAALFHLARLIALREPASLGALGEGVRRLARPSLGLAALLAGVGGAILGNAAFYLTVLRESRLAVVMGFVCLYLLGLLGMMSLYAYPLLAMRGEGPLRALKKSALLALDNVGFTLLLATFTAAVTALVVLPVIMGTPYLVGLSALIALFVYAGFFALLANHALLELLKQY